MTWSRGSAVLVYERGRQDAVRDGRAASYWTAAAHHAGVAHVARFVFTQLEDRARRERRTFTGTGMSDVESIAFYDALKVACPDAGQAFTQTAHADSLRQLWDTATELGAERSSTS